MPITPVPVKQAPPISSNKRITSIEIENFRAYFGKYEPLQLPNGENLLIYGENGSGKSSLFKALFNYLSNSLNPIPYTRNRYNSGDGQVLIEFCDFEKSGARGDGTEQKFIYGSVQSDNSAGFIKSAALVKGFLDYTDLLGVYFHKDPTPNLFDLIVLELLGEHIPQSSGGTYRFKSKWIQLQNDLIKKSYTRNDRSHKDALRDLPVFETRLRTTLTDVFTKLNSLLKGYFPDLQVEVGYQLATMTFYYGSWKGEWRTPAELKLLVKKDGILIANNYTDFLNEARLSAFAVCLYLASLKINPSKVDLKVLYLDDIFIGLDAGNRIPILKMLLDEFSDYQIFLSTYDRHTYELAKKFFDINATAKWRTAEFYVGKHTTSDVTFDKPIIVQAQNDFSRGLFYLHHPIAPDYPACANYFRKYAEDLLSNGIPPHELRDNNLAAVDGYRLSKILRLGLSFFKKIDEKSPLLKELQFRLTSLLHPLSHFNLSSPIYRNELLEIQQILLDLKEYFEKLSDRCIPLFEASTILKLIVPVTATTTYCYEIVLDERIYVVIDPTGTEHLSNCHCHCTRMYPETDNIKGKVTEIGVGVKYKYESLRDCYTKIHAHIVTLPNLGSIVKVTDYVELFHLISY